MAHTNGTLFKNLQPGRRGAARHPSERSDIRRFGFLPHPRRWESWLDTNMGYGELVQLISHPVAGSLRTCTTTSSRRRSNCTRKHRTHENSQLLPPDACCDRETLQSVETLHERVAGDGFPCCTCHHHQLHLRRTLRAASRLAIRETPGWPRGPKNGQTRWTEIQTSSRWPLQSRDGGGYARGGTMSYASTKQRIRVLPSHNIVPRGLQERKLGSRGW